MTGLVMVTWSMVASSAVVPASTMRSAQDSGDPNSCLTGSSWARAESRPVFTAQSRPGECLQVEK